MQRHVIEVTRRSDQLVSVKLCGKEGTVNILSTYQLGEEQKAKEEFLDELFFIGNILSNANRIIRADLNAQVHTVKAGFGGHGTGTTNSEGENSPTDLSGTGLDDHKTLPEEGSCLITYASGGHKSQIDPFLTKGRGRS